ncbi:MAG: DUF1932 domain-containing protein [Acidiferrobacterales bacterium]
MSVTIGFIGFGEAAYHIAKGLRTAGAPPIFAYDIARDDPARRSAIEARAADAEVGITESIEGLAKRVEVILSTVVSSSAVAAAEAAAPYLKRHHFYVDLNSTSPEVKQQIAAVTTKAGARFIEAAVMAGVPPLGHKVPMLLCGNAVPTLVEKLAPYDMNLENFGREVGRATATKMFRSIVVKGLEALFIECVLAASRYGVAERVLESVQTGYPGIDWNKLASYLIGRTAIHGKRRAHEMEEVARTLEAMGIEPIMADAAARRILDAANAGLKARFGDTPPASYHEVVQAIVDARLGAKTE